jgi:hypothetical protein
LESSYEAVCDFWHGEYSAIDRFNKEILVNKVLIMEMIHRGELEDGDGDQFLII